tara:strand:- start:17 stop:259 length:243 start_codon:yes stop_codon:yes gene_type:complete
MKVFLVAIVMWWSNPTDTPYKNAIEIDSLNGKPFFFVKQEECFKYVDENLEGLKQFGHNYFTTADAVSKIYCVPKEQKDI